MLAGNTGDGGDQRDPSAGSINLIEAQQNPGAKSRLHSADVAFDFFAFRKHLSVLCGQRFG